VAIALVLRWIQARWRRLALDLDGLDLRMDDELQDIDIPVQRDGSDR
jgi:hypothetical protein